MTSLCHAAICLIGGTRSPSSNAARRSSSVLVVRGRAYFEVVGERHELLLDIVWILFPFWRTLYQLWNYYCGIIENQRIRMENS